MSNCYLYAIQQWWRHGGYIIIRKSRWGWWAHMMWSPDLVIAYDFQPVKRPHKRMFPPPLFKGYVRVSKIRDMP